MPPIAALTGDQIDNAISIRSAGQPGCWRLLHDCRAAKAITAAAANASCCASAMNHSVLLLCGWACFLIRFTASSSCSSCSPCALVPCRCGETVFIICCCCCCYCRCNLTSFLLLLLLLLRLTQFYIVFATCDNECKLVTKLRKMYAKYATKVKRTPQQQWKYVRARAAETMGCADMWMAIAHASSITYKRNIVAMTQIWR